MPEVEDVEGLEAECGAGGRATNAGGTGDRVCENEKVKSGSLAQLVRSVNGSSGGARRWPKGPDLAQAPLP